ncbi:hypothetical protein CMUS01_07378 [Colletotrichum musicola]|uniref:Uncharacterized protein n=1 Tax=Colletotrichum musicola TaxID=2175873 RepID=A0A8H6NG48_9PEZI|nr:hypothetical protein CMUS01_07378 [Colletotrichum musicola]
MGIYATFFWQQQVINARALMPEMRRTAHDRGLPAPTQGSSQDDLRGTSLPAQPSLENSPAEPAKKASNIKDTLYPVLYGYF